MTTHSGVISALRRLHEVAFPLFFTEKLLVVSINSGYERSLVPNDCFVSRLHQVLEDVIRPMLTEAKCISFMKCIGQVLCYEPHEECNEPPAITELPSSVFWPTIGVFSDTIG